MLTHNISMNNAPASANANAAAVRPTGSQNNNTAKTAPEPARSAERTGAAKEPDRAKDAKRPDEQQAGRPRIEEERENVVAVSEFGDTVQVSDEGNEELDESRIGSVSAREAEEAETATFQAQQEIEAPEIEPPPPPPEPPRPPEEILKEQNEKLVEAKAERDEIFEAVSEGADENSAPQASSTFAGISDQQLEQMYLDGSISRYDYQTEIDAREARDQEMRSESESLAKESAELNKQTDVTENMAAAIDTVTSGETSETIPLDERLDAVEQVQLKEAGEARREEEQGRLWDIQLTA